jgi:dihydrofolate reductase
MAELRVHNFSVSLDGFAAGPGQTTDDPLGVGGERLHEWMFAPDADRTDHRFRARGEEGIGATIMGRNMFGPVRGPWSTWPGEPWTGWWGEDPPFHHDVFVLTHHARPPVRMAGGTTFSFVTDGIEAALERATAAAGGADVRLGGGVATVHQFLRAGLLDELHVVVVPVLLGAGERVFADGLFGGRPDVAAGWRCVEFAASGAVAHVRLRRTGREWARQRPVPFDTMSP